MVIRNKCYNTCFYLHDQFRIRNLFIVHHDTLRRLSWWTEPIHIWIWMPNMENFHYDIVRQSIQIRISPKRGKCTWNSNLWTKCWTERRSHVFKFSDGYKSTMDRCSVYLTPQALSKYNYLSPPLIFPTTSAELGQKTARCVNHSGRCSITLNGTESSLGAKEDWGLRYRIYLYMYMSMRRWDARL
jgi:hypothetical protein